MVRKRKKKNIYKLLTFLLKIIFIVLIAFLIKLGYDSLIKDESNKNSEETKETEIKPEEEKDEKEEEKYTKEEKEKLEKLNYINEKVDYFKWENIDRYISYKENNEDLDLKKVILYVNIGLDNNFYTNTTHSPNEYENTVLVNKYYYVDNNHVPKNQVSVGNGRKLEKEAADAFNKLKNDAKEEGYTIRAVSTIRSYSYQKNLYNNYVERDGIEKADTYSARAGFSEHQTGLAVDVDNAKVSYTSFGKTDEFNWMKENAYKYGFILRYTKENEFITGYQSEAWHYRYVGVEIATQMKNENISSYEEYYFMYLDK